MCGKRSGSVDEELVHRFHGEGLADVLQKPATTQALLAKIDGIVVRGRGAAVDSTDPIGS